MTDSTNPRIIADNIRALFKKIKAAVVNANPEGEATGTLTKLEVKGSIYAIPQGTNVTANPEGEATGSLTSLGIGGVKYSIPVYSPQDYSTTEYSTGKKWIDDKDVFGIVIHLASPLAMTGNWVSTGVPWSGKSIITNCSAVPLGFGTYEGTLLVKGFADTSVQDIVVEYTKDTVSTTRKKSTSTK